MKVLRYTRFTRTLYSPAPLGEYSLLYISSCKTWIKSSHPEVFLGKGVLKICSKFKGEHPCQSATSGLTTNHYQVFQNVFLLKNFVQRKCEGEQDVSLALFISPTLHLILLILLTVHTFVSIPWNSLKNIWDELRDFFSEPASLLKVPRFHMCFPRFLNWENATKSRNASHVKKKPQCKWICKR